MNVKELDAAIEQANRIFSLRYRPSEWVQRDAEPSTSEPRETDWSSESIDARRRFCQSHANLFPYLGRKVRTPAGPGVLFQVFADRVTILLDSELDRCSFFRPGEIEPVSWELP
jgi:hypothetical protein